MIASIIIGLVIACLFVMAVRHVLKKRGCDGCCGCGCGCGDDCHCGRDQE